MKILITICARGGSKGIPGKNIKLLNGKPLIYYSLKTAALFSTKYHTDIFLSTDSDKIKQTVHLLKFDNVNTAYVRPVSLGTDEVGKLDVINDLKNHAENVMNKEYDFVIDLDVTSPLRTVMDIENGLKILKHSEAYNLFSVNSAERNPYFNMVEKDGTGFYNLCKRGDFKSRQVTPEVYELNASFYIYDKSFFGAAFNTAITPKSMIYRMPHMCFDLDSNLDFDFMEYLLVTNKLDFTFEL